MHNANRGGHPNLPAGRVAMKASVRLFRLGLRALAVATLAALLAVPEADAQQKHGQKQTLGPLVLKSASYFYIGGKIDERDKGSPIVGHMYVEYMIPQQQRYPYPIIMV